MSKLYVAVVVLSLVVLSTLSLRIARAYQLQLPPVGGDVVAEAVPLPGDADGDGTITPEELLALEEEKRAGWESQLNANRQFALKNFDQNRNGVIDPEDRQALLDHIGRLFWKPYDTDMDGKLNAAERLAWEQSNDYKFFTLREKNDLDGDGLLNFDENAAFYKEYSTLVGLQSSVGPEPREVSCDVPNAAGAWVLATEDDGSKEVTASYYAYGWGAFSRASEEVTLGSYVSMAWGQVRHIWTWYGVSPPPPSLAKVTKIDHGWLLALASGGRLCSVKSAASMSFEGPSASGGDSPPPYFNELVLTKRYGDTSPSWTQMPQDQKFVDLPFTVTGNSWVITGKCISRSSVTVNVSNINEPDPTRRGMSQAVNEFKLLSSVTIDPQ